MIFLFSGFFDKGFSHIAPNTFFWYKKHSFFIDQVLCEWNFLKYGFIQILILLYFYFFQNFYKKFCEEIYII